MPVEMDQFDSTLARDKLQEYGMGAVGSTGMTPDMCIASDDHQVREKGMMHMKHATDLTAALGASVLSGALYAAFGWRPPAGRTRQQWRQSVSSLRELARYASDHGVTLAIEPLNRYEHYFLNTVEQAVVLANEVGEPNLKVHVDTYHMNIEEKDLYAAVGSRLQTKAGEIDMEMEVQYDLSTLMVMKMPVEPTVFPQVMEFLPQHSFNLTVSNWSCSAYNRTEVILGVDRFRLNRFVDEDLTS
jgi:hypothetical protein